MTRITITLSDELADAIRRIAEAEDRPISRVLRQALVELVEKKKEAIGNG